MSRFIIGLLPRSNRGPCGKKNELELHDLHSAETVKQAAFLNNSISAREFEKECKAVLTSHDRALGLAVDLVFSGKYKIWTPGPWSPWTLSVDRVHGQGPSKYGPGPWTPFHGPGPWTSYFYELRLHHKLRFIHGLL